MPRNASAIALKIYTLVVVAAMLFGVFPLPVPLQLTHPLYRYGTLVFIVAGCTISLVGIAWPRSQKNKSASRRANAILDGSVVEQGGLLLTSLGMIMFGLAFSPIWPMGLFTSLCCGGFAVAFIVQYLIIHKWRLGLRKLANEQRSASG